jgi:hypothetical protein
MEDHLMRVTTQIFLSYARPDQEKVEAIYERLSDAGFNPWMDTKDILPGEQWEVSILKAIQDSNFFLIFLSAKSISKRGFLQKEVKDALDILDQMLESDIYLIPVRLENCEVPERLRHLQWVDLFEPDGWERLIRAIREGMERRATPTNPIAEESSPSTTPRPGEEPCTEGEPTNEGSTQGRTCMESPIIQGANEPSNSRDGKVREISFECFQWVLDFQTPWGEWGDSGYNYEERLRRIQRQHVLSHRGMLAKPNMFRTLLGLETISWLAEDRFRSRRDLAFKWIDQQVNEGWFWAWVAEGTTIDPDHSYKEIHKAEDIRHTAQAALVDIKFRTLKVTTIKTLENLLGCQTEGGWPESLSMRKSPKLISTVYVAELLYAISHERFQKQLTQLGRDDLNSKVQAALNRARGWLIERNQEQGGLWEKTFRTTIVLQRIGRVLVSDYHGLIMSTVNRLYEIRDGITWVDEQETDPEKREMTRFPTTVRVVSCLMLLSKHGLVIDKSVLSSARDYLIDKFSPELLDAPDFAYLLQIVCRDPQQVEAVRNYQYYDYLNASESPHSSQRERVGSLLNTWWNLSVERLGRLQRGVELNVQDYKSVYQEEMSKLLAVVKVLARVSGGEGFRELEQLLAQSPDIETLLSAIERMTDQNTLKRTFQAVKSAGYSIYTEFLPKLIAELLKR